MKRITFHHAEWLELLEVSGPFLSLPVLERVFPQGLDVHDPDHAAKLRLAREEWAEEQERAVPDPEVHDAWIRLVLAETLEYTPEVLLERAAIAPEVTVEVAEHQETLRPDFVLSDPEDAPDARRARLLVQVYPPGQHLDGLVEASEWAASPATRMAYLCRAVGVRLGLVTNGERWVLVDAPRGETAAFVSWYASLWPQEPITLRAFRSLLGVRRFFGVDPSETLEAMLADSATYQAEVTEQLGAQVRRAVEVLVQTLDRADTDSGRQLLGDVPEAALYEAALTVMMRLVFLFFAEENDLLPLSEELYQQSYAASTLRGQLREEADRVGLEVLERRQDAWNRLLATFRAIYGGVEHDALHLPAYGGSLFDPDRFPFLEGRPRGTTWHRVEAQPLPIDNRTVLHLLDALQLLQMRGSRGTEARKLSFRALDIEQIGHVYEMLLDHQVLRADAPGLGLVGAKGAEPEVALQHLEHHRARGAAALLEFLQEETKKSRPALEKALAKQPDPTWVGRLQAACGDDAALLERVLPYHGLIRTDPWGEPIVIRRGALFVTAGTERRATGTYYTPRALTEEVVTHALEPLVYRGPAEGAPREEWKLKSATELLGLKVCDPAMGSGAFLVQVIRWLSERLVEAWEEAEDSGGTTISPEGEAPRGVPSELVVPANAEERLALARRLIADRCIYGVDVNPLAVEMAKLSLWLVTLAKGRPFSFLDHALRCGDSLLGVRDLDQIRRFHVDPERGRDLHATLFDPTRHIESAIEEALRLRRELESFTVTDIRDAEQKAALNRRAENALARVRMLGDLVTGVAISTAKRGGDALDTKLQSLADELPSILDQTGTAADANLLAEAQVMLNQGKPPMTPDRRAFHWPVEFPEVFLKERPGFDAMIGNPPFKGGQYITGALGSDYREYLVDQVARGARGSADLVAYFFLRAASLVRMGGMIGLLATNTISQGGTREVGLDRLASNGWSIARAWKSRPWPGDASIQIAQLWLHHGDWGGPSVLDGAEVPGVSTSLDRQSRVSGPAHPLKANTGLSFQGPIVLGMGFVLTPEKAEALTQKDPRNRDVLFPYLNGEDLNSSPLHSPSRWVINFFDWPLEKAEWYPECLAIVREKVKPVRDRDNRKAYRERWWQYAEKRRALYEAIEGLERVMAIALTSKTVMPVFVPTGIVYSHALGVFAYEDDAHLGLLTSAFHWWWAVTRASTMRTDLRYTPTDCFETLPHPRVTEEVAGIAKALKEHRRGLMIEHNEGLTKTYNRVNDAEETSIDVLTLREHHVRLDHAVAAAYGWNDLDLDHDFHPTPQGIRYTLGPEVRGKILDRLLELNHERHAAESVGAQRGGRR
jgi:hypothetical protein